MASAQTMVVLVSGGLDSSVLLADLRARGHTLHALSFHYGAKHNRRELAAARRLCRRLDVPWRLARLDFMRRLYVSHLLEGGGAIPHGHYADAVMRQTVVPFRNGVMLAAAAGYAESVGASAVAIAAHGGDHAIYPDCRPAFLRAMGAAMRLGSYAHIALRAPYLKRSKGDLVTLGARLGVDFAATWSCYEGGRWHCGACGTCVERREAFQHAGIDDPTCYARDR